MLDVRRNELSWAGPAGLDCGLVDCVGLCGLDLGRLGSTGALGSRLSARLGSWAPGLLGLLWAWTRGRGTWDDTQKQRRQAVLVQMAPGP